MPTLHWVGKAAVLNHHAQVPLYRLQAVPALSAGPADSGNLLVEGDNLLALRALLPSYRGQVKCVYIDPPYNTGHEDWAYNDAVNGPEIRSWLGQVVGADAADLSRHDKWLCMMYPRLQLLRLLLREDGVLFASIDDTELANLVGLCDEVFGPRQRLAVFTRVRKKKGSNLNKELRKLTEFVVAYKRSPAPLDLYGVPAYGEKQVPLLNRANPPSTVRFPAGRVRAGQGLADGPVQRGPFGAGELRVVLENDVTVCGAVLVTAFSLTGRFRWSQDTIDHELAHGSLFTVSRTFRVNVRRYNQADKFKAPSSLLSPDDGIGTNEDATRELRSIFPECDKLPFDFPKPVSLVRYLVHAVCRNDPDALVLDSFAGSGTTGHAVLALNRQDGGRRRFILVETDPAICQAVTARRLGRVIRGYTTPAANGNEQVEGLGGGFCYCKLGALATDPMGTLRCAPGRSRQERPVAASDP